MLLISVAAVSTGYGAEITKYEITRTEVNSSVRYQVVISFEQTEPPFETGETLHFAYFPNNNEPIGYHKYNIYYSGKTSPEIVFTPQEMVVHAQQLKSRYKEQQKFFNTVFQLLAQCREHKATIRLRQNERVKK